ncbi:hypothetical protein NBM05_05180 [Rothia sp. AR01]|uniref:Uncharacterized protein n=1 Tax=Rothia santali TaxID=2949643 RepID=A0A9X2KKU6_9MICC|nr:hypothetical protein [Rothia santali]MCP3425426.1 hypothetical protein [Rothia santali]
MDELELWTGFNGALAAASAALAGLIMVVLSVNVREVLAYPGVSARAAASLALLVLTLVCSLLGLIPAGGTVAYGALTLAGCVVVWAIAGRAMYVLARNPASAAHRPGGSGPDDSCPTPPPGSRPAQHPDPRSAPPADPRSTPLVEPHGGRATNRDGLRHLAGNGVVFLGPLVLFSVGGVLLLLGLPSGTYWLAYGSLGALAGSMLFSWIALIEILR